MVLKVVHDGVEVIVPGTARGEPLIRAISQEQISHEIELGFGFTWVSDGTDIGAGATMLIVRNTSDRFLIMTELVGHPASALCEYSYFVGNSTTTLAGGSAVVPVNLNRTFSNTTFDHDAQTGETAVADGTLAGHLWVNTTNSHHHNLHGLILGKNDFIQVNQITNPTSGAIQLTGFFIPELQ